MNIICPYCNNPAECVSGQVAYPHRRDLWRKQFWVCVPCDARVGCHGKSDKPLGRLADDKLRQARGRAHRVFDPLHRRGSMSRSQAYAWLAEALGVTAEECHIGEFDVDQCKRVVEVCHANSIA